MYTVPNFPVLFFFVVSSRCNVNVLIIQRVLQVYDEYGKYTSKKTQIIGMFSGIFVLYFRL